MSLNSVINSQLRKEIAAWLLRAKENAKSSVSFGENVWADCHGGGTSRSPYCRPQGIRNSQGDYSIQLLLLNYSSGRGANTQTLQAISAVSFGKKQPTKDEVYDKLSEIVENAPWAAQIRQSSKKSDTSLLRNNRAVRVNAAFGGYVTLTL
ncbi:hypothetical protein DACRYDRAFT_16806 [Dacryopinax primogenitus]|uniref:Uncharacterized protein n=1 Tax=Dacryopinax primogenitus (strain DJM 731) TaxID=1858805 RepID=M5FS96_DACPD|nr:uncharacterized protein DACRYDRAFT_16806 [Dacryopinax primogenitus]EJU00246.1 hypothetical protein DACRYDRAFT_16806 [Dacryopinax primogenitus]